MYGSVDLPDNLRWIELSREGYAEHTCQPYFLHVKPVEVLIVRFPKTRSEVGVDSDFEEIDEADISIMNFSGVDLVLPSLTQCSLSCTVSIIMSSCLSHQACKTSLVSGSRIGFVLGRKINGAIKQDQSGMALTWNRLVRVANS